MSTTVRDTYGFSVSSADQEDLTASERTVDSRFESGDKQREKWGVLLGKLTGLEAGVLAGVTSRWGLAHTPHRSLAFRVLRSKVGLDTDGAEHLGAKFTKYIRRGVPTEMREQVWRLCAGGSAKAEDAVRKGERSYEDLLAYVESRGVDESGLPRLEVASEVEKDLRRTFPNNSHFESEQGLGALRTLLVAYGVRNPKVSDNAYDDIVYAHTHGKHGKLTQLPIPRSATASL